VREEEEGGREVRGRRRGRKRGGSVKVGEGRGGGKE